MNYYNMLSALNYREADTLPAPQGASMVEMLSLGGRNSIKKSIVTTVVPWV